MQPGDGLILNVPPRHGKTDSVSAFIEHEIGQYPDHSAIYATYGADLTNEVSRKIRDSVKDEPAFKQYFPNVTLSETSFAVKRWATNYNGLFLPTSIGGSITGKGQMANIAVVDDPIKDYEEALSKTARDKANRWFFVTFLSRVTPMTKLIVNQARWHHSDVTGMLLRKIAKDPYYLGLKWKVLTLQGLTKAEDGTEVALWPKLWPAWILQKRREAEPRAFEAVYQQNPVAEDAIVFRDAYYYQSDALPRAGYKKLIAVDFAYSKKSHSDWTVILTALYAPQNAQFFITDMVRVQTPIEKTLGLLRASQEASGGTCIYTRTGGQEEAIVDLIAREGIAIVSERTKGDKLTNAQPVARAWNQGKILLPETANWVEVFLDEVQNFTGVGDSHDDIVDALVTIYKWAHKGERRVPVTFDMQVTGEGSLEDYDVLELDY